MPASTVLPNGTITNLESKYIKQSNGCWIWIRGCTFKGYPCVWNGKIMDEAHRVIYEQTKGKISEGYDLHHICENKKCVNPDHLEQVLHSRHKAKHKKTHCKRGHELTKENTYLGSDGYRRCKICISKKA